MATVRPRTLGSLRYDELINSFSGAFGGGELATGSTSKLACRSLRDIANALGLSGSDSVHKAINQFAKTQSEEDSQRIARIQNNLLPH